MKKLTITLVALIMTLSLVLAGCAGASYDTAKSEAYEIDSPAAAPAETEMATAEEVAYDNGEAYAEEPAPEEAGGIVSGIGDVSVPQDASRKIILTYNISVQTKEFDADVAVLNDAIGKAGGYVSYSEMYGQKPETMYDGGRQLQLTYRVPVEHVAEFVKVIDSGLNGVVVNSSSNANDVTSSYNDIELRLESLHSLYDQLQALLKTAATTEDTVELYREMADVTYEIEGLEGQLRYYDDQVSYTTVTLSLTEVNTITGTDKPEVEPTFGERVSTAFYDVINWLGDFFQGFGVVLIAATPILLILGVIAGIVIWIVVGTKKKRAKKQAAKKAAEAKTDEK